MAKHRDRIPSRRQFWRNHLEAWQSSGLSKAAYCRQHDLVTGSFYQWSHLLNKTASVAHKVAAPPKLLEVKVLDAPPVTSPTTTARITRSGTVVELPATLSSASLHDWLKVIHALDV